MLRNKKEFLDSLILNKLQNTTFFNRKELDDCLFFVLNQWEDLKEDKRFHLIDYVVSRLTGDDVNKLYTKDDKAVKEKYLAHLLDLSGTVNREENNIYKRLQILKEADPEPSYPIANDLLMLQKKGERVHGYWGSDCHETRNVKKDNWEGFFNGIQGIITKHTHPAYITFAVSQFKCAGISLEGWQVSEFLPLRIRALFEMVVKKERENLREPNLNVENQIPFLKRELICELETLQIYQLMSLIYQKPNSGLLISNLSGSIANFIKILQTNQEFTIPVTWQEHALYVSFIKKEGYFLIRIDNLGLDCNKKNPKDALDYHELDGEERCPYLVSGVQINQQYIVNLIMLSIDHMHRKKDKTSNENDFKKIYHPVGFSRRPKNVDLKFPSQTVGNCVVAGHQVGLRSRLGSVEFLKEVLTEERIILMRLFGRERSNNIDCFKPLPDFYLKPMDFFNKQVKKIYAASQAQHSTLRSLPLDQLTFNMVATDYWYTDQDINRLMQSVRQENTICLSALLATHLGLNYEELKQVLNNEKQKKQNDQNSFKRIFFPINISLYQSQWVLLVIDFDGNFEQPSFLYFDPMGRAEHETLMQVLHSIWPNALLNSFPKISISEEGDSTGLWIVEAVRELSKNNSLKSLENLDRSQIRQEQMTTLGKASAVTQSNHQPAQDVVKIWLEQNNKTGLWISGPAGYGKSQLCNFLATQDMSPLLRSGEMFFWISLRHVRENLVAFGENPQEYKEILRTLIDLITTSMNLSFLPWWKQSVLKHILKKKPVIWMFDGYDELSQEEQGYFLTLISLFGKQDPNFSNHRCVVTTRPQFVLPADMPSMQFEQLASLSFEGTINYIEKFFEDDQQKGRNLEQFLRSRPAWQQLLAIPFNLQLLSNIWHQNSRLESLIINTTTELYLAVFKSMLRHAYVKKFAPQQELREKSLTGHYDQAVRKMEKLAYTLMSQKTLSAEVSFDKEIESDINEIGFLCVNGSRVEYLHKTFCEFMCASYIAKNIHKDLEIIQFISKNKYDPYFSKVWPFVAGLLHSLKKGHQPLFWNILLAKPWEIGIQHVSLVLNCLEESQLNEKVPQHEELKNFILTCWEKVKIWAKSAFSCISAMTLLEKTLFDFFASSPYVFEKILKDPFYELLTIMNDPVALLKAMNYQNLPDELVDKLLLRMNDGDVRISNILIFSNISREKIHELIDNIQRWQANYPRLNESLPKGFVGFSQKGGRDNRYLEFSRSLVYLLKKYAPNFESALKCLMIWASGLQCDQEALSFQELSFEAICQFNLADKKHLETRAELAISLLKDPDKRNFICHIDDFGSQEHETRIVDLAISYYDSPDNTKGVCYASEAYSFYKKMLQILDLNLLSLDNRLKIRRVLNKIFLSDRIEEKRQIALEILDKHNYLSFSDDMFEKLLFCHPFFSNSIWEKKESETVTGKKLFQIIYEKLTIRHIERLAENVFLENRLTLIDQLLTSFECFYNNFSYKSNFHDVFNDVFSNESVVKIFESLGESQNANRISQIIKNYSPPEKIKVPQYLRNSLPRYVNENNKISQEREKLLNLKEIYQILTDRKLYYPIWGPYISSHDWLLDQLVCLNAQEIKILFDGNASLTTSTFIEIVKTYLINRDPSWLNVIFSQWNPSIHCLVTQERLLINGHPLSISEGQIVQVENVVAHLWKKLWKETSHTPLQRFWEAPVEILEIVVDRNLLFSHQAAKPLKDLHPCIYGNRSPFNLTIFEGGRMIEQNPAQAQNINLEL